MTSSAILLAAILLMLIACFLRLGRIADLLDGAVEDAQDEAPVDTGPDGHPVPFGTDVVMADVDQLFTRGPHADS